ncbi:MAG: hypothetical protein OHK0028_15000 [Deltaproteobacteria bacterium]
MLKPGRTLIVAESEVRAVRDGKEKLVAKATVTLAPVAAGGNPEMDRSSAGREDLVK